MDRPSSPRVWWPWMGRRTMWPWGTYCQWSAPPPPGLTVVIRILRQSRKLFLSPLFLKVSSTMWSSSIDSKQKMCLLLAIKIFSLSSWKDLHYTVLCITFKDYLGYVHALLDWFLCQHKNQSNKMCQKMAHWHTSKKCQFGMVFKMAWRLSSVEWT